jgi:serine beta-lactamase-like protein LACTB, mitochondrial
MLLLVEQGKLDLDAPIQRYVPSFPEKGAVITARMLAGHQGRKTDIIEQRARFYSSVAKDKKVQNAALVDNSYKWAGGGFLSTSEDLVRFGTALLQPGFLRAESLALLFTPQKTKDGEKTKYGIGWFVTRSKSGRQIYEHSSGSVGGSSEVIIYPDAHLVVAFVRNFSGPDDGWKAEEVQSLGEAFETK